ncbi:MAG: hypothetical protein U0002_10815 [Thermoanaerobaculia bacterium]
MPRRRPAPPPLEPLAEEPGPGRPAPKAFEGAVARAFSAAFAGLPETLPAEELRRLAAALARYQPGQQRLYLRNRPQARTVSLAKHLLSTARKAVHRGAEPARRAAEAALATAESLPAEGPGRALRQDLRAEACAQLANALRLNEEHSAAAERFAEAWQLAATGSGDPLLQARLGSLEASLHLERRAFSEAERSLRTVAFLYRLLGDEPGEAQAHSKLGRTYYLAGRPEDCIAAFYRVLELAEPAGAGGALHVVAAQGIAHAAEDLGLFRLAFGIAQDLPPLLARHCGPLAALRGRWLAGRLAASVGRLELAMAELEEVRLGFLRRSLLLDASLASLDLAWAYALRGRPDRQKRLAEEMLPVFTAHGLPQEATAAFLLYANAAQNYRVTRALAEELRQRLTPLRRGG